MPLSKAKRRAYDRRRAQARRKDSKKLASDRRLAAQRQALWRSRHPNKVKNRWVYQRATDPALLDAAIEIADDAPFGGRGRTKPLYPQDLKWYHAGDRRLDTPISRTLSARMVTIKSSIGPNRGIHVHPDNDFGRELWQRDLDPKRYDAWVLRLARESGVRWAADSKRRNKSA